MTNMSEFSGGRQEAKQANVAQMVEHKLPKLGVAGSIPVIRSRKDSETDC